MTSRPIIKNNVISVLIVVLMAYFVFAGYAIMRVTIHKNI
jgi:hypothetical protein